MSLLNTKIFLNSDIYDIHKGTRYSTADIKHYYLNNPMENFQYMNIPTRFFTDEIREEYDITNLAPNGIVRVEIHKGIYGLKEAGIIDFKRLVKNVTPNGYHPVKHVPGLYTAVLWRHATRKIVFTLAVNDFGIKYSDMKDIQHLLASL